MRKLAKAQGKLSQEEFLELYYRLRNKEERRLLGRLSLKTRKRVHPFVLFVYKLKNRLGGFRYEMIGDKHSNTERPYIFALTHVGKFDIEVVSEAIREHYYLLTGDFEHLQGTIYEAFLSINGVIYFNENVKKDRQSASERMINLLREGGNLMYFPEGTWNMTEHLPVLPCYWGIVDVAQRGNAVVVPVACEQYGKTFKVDIGENIYMENYSSDTEGKSKAITELRDSLATLKLGIWESETLVKRKTLKKDTWEKYCTERFDEWKYFNMEHINSLVFKPKGVVSKEEVFAFMERLIPRRENAFLWRRK